MTRDGRRPTIGIRSAAYSLPSSSTRVADWCFERSAPSELQADLEAGGCDQFHYATTESLVDLGAAAVRQVLAQGAIAPEQVDALVVCHTSPASVLPFPFTLAGRLREVCNLRGAYAFSVNQQQCVSSLHALRVLDHLFEKHSDWQAAIVVTSDILLSERHRAVARAGAHSDAASALLLTRDAPSAPLGLQTHADPRAARQMTADTVFESDRNYVWTLVSTIRRVLRAAAVSPGDVGFVLPHNVNLPAWRRTLDALGIAQTHLFHDNFGRIGHAFGSDVAINITDSGALRTPGSHLVVSSGVGGCMGGFILNTKVMD